MHLLKHSNIHFLYSRWVPLHSASPLCLYLRLRVGASFHWPDTVTPEWWLIAMDILYNLQAHTSMPMKYVKRIIIKVTVTASKIQGFLLQIEIKRIWVKTLTTTNQVNHIKFDQNVLSKNLHTSHCLFCFNSSQPIALLF